MTDKLSERLKKLVRVPLASYRMYDGSEIVSPPAADAVSAVELDQIIDTATVSDASGAMLVERLAAWDHEAWAGWMRYLWTKIEWGTDGNGTLRLEWRQRWERQMSLPYSDLSESERESDRKEAREILAVIGDAERDQGPLSELSSLRQGKK